MVKHIMADGTKRDTIDGLVIPYNRNTELIYRVVIEALSEGGGGVDSVPENHAQASQKAAN